MLERLHFYLNRLGERLWVKPLIVCLLSIIAAFAAKLADYSQVAEHLPNITLESLETLLTVMSSSMLVIATFSVGSMVAAYASASNSATPRSFMLIIADDVSQNALSTFIGSFIFSIVAQIALLNNVYGNGGRFAIFAVTLLVFTLVIITFVRWMDNIARLGRMGATIGKVEKATSNAIAKRLLSPSLKAMAIQKDTPEGTPVFASSIGYVQRVDVAYLNAEAERQQLNIEIAALPGTFAAPGKVLVYITPDASRDKDEEIDNAKIISAFIIGKERLFDEDPRFGFIVLSEIASRALSPAVNDPGTAIGIMGVFTRLFHQWYQPANQEAEKAPVYSRVQAPIITSEEVLEDAFTCIARDGSNSIEIMIRLLKTFHAIASIGDVELNQAVFKQAEQTMLRAKRSDLLELEKFRLDELFQKLAEKCPPVE